MALAAGKNVADIIPNATFRIIKGMGHDLPELQIPLLVDIITENASKAGK